jgi:hypothetical protein
MAYQEYFNYNNACATAYYTQYYNYCSVTHNNYWNCSTHYSNHANWHKDHKAYYNYTNCAIHYDELSNMCSTYTNYNNLIRYSNPNSGDPVTLSWQSPWSGDNLTSEYLYASIDGMIEVRDKIKWLSTHKGQQNVSDTLIDSADVNDDSFDDGNSNTSEYVVIEQYENFKITLNDLYSALSAGDPGLPNNAVGTLSKKVDIEKLKIETDDLAEANLSAAYSNYSNNTSCSHGSHFNSYITDDDGTHSNYAQHLNAKQSWNIHHNAYGVSKYINYHNS